MPPHRVASFFLCFLFLLLLIPLFFSLSALFVQRVYVPAATSSTRRLPTFIFLDCHDLSCLSVYLYIEANLRNQLNWFLVNGIEQCVLTL